MRPFEFVLRTRAVFGPRAFERLGALAREHGFRRTLLVADRGILAAGYVERAMRMLSRESIAVAAFHEFDSDPDTRMCEAAAQAARAQAADSVIGVGGGSSLDVAKAVAFLVPNGGSMRDYHGYALARAPLLPGIGVPTTAGTGSEAQSYALVSDEDTHEKMACGDPGAAFRVAVLDPLLTVTQPGSVTAIAGFDAITHAVETWVTTRRNPISEAFSREAWRLLEGAYERVLRAPDDLPARADMQLGAFLAGAAIEASMLGAAHACANPLTARYGTTHGIAVGLMLPHVVRWNAPAAGERYAELLRIAGRAARADPAAALADRLDALARAGGLPRRLQEAGAAEADLPRLAEDAAAQWTGRFNPRPFDAAAALELYQAAF